MRFYLHTQNPRRFSEFAVVVVFFEILNDFHDFVFGMCFHLENQQPILGGHSFFRRRCVAAPLLKGGSGAVRPAQLAEAGFDSCHSFAALFEHCESHTARSHRVNVTLHENLSCSCPCCRTACTTHNSPACDTGVHDATRVIRLSRNSGNSSDSWGDTEAGRTSFLCPWGNKVTEYEYSVRGQTADAFKVACRDVGRPTA